MRYLTNRGTALCLLIFVSAMVAAYIIPPALTILVNLINAALYQTRVVPMIYAVCMVQVFILGWIATLILWNMCNTFSMEPDCELESSMIRKTLQITSLSLLSILPQLWRVA